MVVEFVFVTSEFTIPESGVLHRRESAALDALKTQAGRPALFQIPRRRPRSIRLRLGKAQLDSPSHGGRAVCNFTERNIR